MVIGRKVRCARYCFLPFAELFFYICYGSYNFEDSEELIVESAGFNVHWRLRGALSGNRFTIVLTIAVSFWPLGLHERVSYLIGAAHDRVAHESLEPLSSVRIAEVHDDMCAIDVLLRHIFVGFHSMRLRLNRLKNVDNSLKHLSAHFLFYHLIEGPLLHFFKLIEDGHCDVFN